MAAECRSYASHAEALEAVEAVLATGVAGDRVRVLMGQPSRDTHDLPVGEFAGETEPGERVGAFAGGAHARDEAVGAFAGGRRRGGSFSDADRELVTSYPEGVEHVRVASHRHVRALLLDAGLDEAAAQRDVDALHAGRVLVLVDAR